MRDERQERNQSVRARATLRSATTWCRRFGILCLVLVATTIASLAQTFTTLVSFDGNNGQNPAYASLAQGLDGNLFGTTEFGGANGSGTVFEITPTGTLNSLFSFDCTGACPEQPLAGLALGTDGSFYGTSQSAPIDYGTVFKISSSGALEILHSFSGGDGSFPNDAPIQGSDGNFYGTTATGGVNGYGTVFKITPAGVLSTIHNFERN